MYAQPPTGDVNDIKIGNRTNVQDNVTIHTASDASGAPKPTIVGNDCTIGALVKMVLVHVNKIRILQVTMWCCMRARLKTAAWLGWDRHFSTA